MLWHRSSYIIQSNEKAPRTAEKVLCLDRPTAIKSANKGTPEQGERVNLLRGSRNKAAGGKNSKNNSIMLSQ